MMYHVRDCYAAGDVDDSANLLRCDSCSRVEDEPGQFSECYRCGEVFCHVHAAGFQEMDYPECAACEERRADIKAERDFHFAHSS